MKEEKPTLIMGVVHFVNGQNYHLGNSGPYSLQDLIDSIYFSDGVPVSDIVIHYRDAQNRIIALDIQPSGLSVYIDDKRV